MIIFVNLFANTSIYITILIIVDYSGLIEMAKKEVQTDLWVHDLLKEAGIELDAQGSTIKEIDEALKTASKRGTGKVGFPEYVGVVKDFILVIEDKAKLENHIKYDKDKLISLETKDVTDFAVNGALFYAKHLIQNTTYKKVFAFGISGNAKNHRITPLFVDDRLNVFDRLEDVESFISFNEKNIDEYYLCDVLKESSDKEKELEEILADAKVLHEHLRNYGNMKDEEKPLVVSGILLALRKRDNGNFSIDSLNADSFVTDGQKIYNAIESSFKRTDLSPVTKIDKILSQFAIIKDSTKLNEKNATLGETPLKFFAKFLDEKLYKSIKFTRSAEDYLGRFYGEFMRYSGGSGQTLGIVLTPRHITELFCDLLDLKTTDRIFDPCCGTGGFLVAALHSMLSKSESEAEKMHIRKNQLYGIELRPDMFTVATTNMILRGDGKSNLHCDDFLVKNPKQLQTDFRATVGMLNPPYSQGTKKDPSLYEIAFTEHLLDSLLPNSRCAVIVPQSSMTGKSKEEQQIKESILKKHTLEGTIMLQKDTFYGIGVIPCIAVFTAGVPHDKEKVCKFVNFEDDGFKVAPHIGLLETESAKDKKQHLLDVWFDRIESPTKFCVKTTITAEDEWLHSFYYFNDEIPTDKDFEKTVGDYLTFEFSMIMQGRKYLFEQNADSNVKKNFKCELNSREWREFKISEVLGKSNNSKPYHLEYLEKDDKTGLPYVSRTSLNNGYQTFVSSSFDYSLNPADCISFGAENAEYFYQPKEYVAGNKLYYYKKEEHNNFLLKYFVVCLNQSIKNAGFGYGMGLTGTRSDKRKIMLPVTSTGEIDYDFMEEYIKELEAQKLEEYREFSKKRLNECKTNSQSVEQLDEKGWKAFEISEIFSVESGCDIYDKERIKGFIPYITSSAMNNGIKYFVSNKNATYESNVISVNRNGSVGYAFYHKYFALYSNDCRKLKIKAGTNESLALFMTNQIMQQKDKYNYSVKMGTARLLRQKILLPTDSSGNPDYAYMESYIKNLMAQKYTEYLEFKK